MSENQNILGSTTLQWVHGLEGLSGSTICNGKKMSKEMDCEVRQRRSNSHYVCDTQ